MTRPTKNALRKRVQYRRDILRSEIKAERMINSRAFQKTKKSLYSLVKARAKRLRIPFAISFEQFLAAWPASNRCRYCNRRMRRLTYSAASVDKIIPKRGYVVGNVDIICRMCNLFKSGGSLDFLELVVARMREVL